MVNKNKLRGKNFSHVLKEIDNVDPVKRMEHERIYNNSNHPDQYGELRIEPLKGLMLEAGNVLDGHSPEHSAIYHSNFGETPIDVKTFASKSYNNLIEVLAPFLMDSVFSDMELSNILKMKDIYRNKIHENLQDADFKKMHPHMVKRTPHHHKHHEDATDYILQEVINEVVR